MAGSRVIVSRMKHFSTDHIAVVASACQFLCHKHWPQILRRWLRVIMVVKMPFSSGSKHLWTLSDETRNNLMPPFQDTQQATIMNCRHKC
mmetsp:Transcript_69942/g.149739  ORF Transcript_69942/g.149739 Transcript_69942/m.149739 type:complete len:90 (-) Transcript_69942:51-320(-)